MERSHFEKLVADGFEAVPEKFRKKVQNVVFLVEDEPSEKVRREEGLAAEETLFGLYVGWPLDERGDHYGVGPTMPDTIIIYQKPIEDEAKAILEERLPKGIGRYEDSIREIVADTVWHEVAHHFGFDEKEVRYREERRKD